MANPISRFEDKYVPEPNSGCWLWTAATHRFGYGRMTLDGKVQEAHRVSWQLHEGPIPSGMQVCHKCDNPACVNPAHLFLGSARDNMRDCRDKGRLFTPRAENSHLTKDQVDEIRAITGRLRRGEAKELCAKYGIVHSTLYRIRSGMRWRATTCPA